MHEHLAPLRTAVFPWLTAVVASGARVLRGLQRDLGFLACLAAALVVLVWNALGYWPQMVDDSAIVFSYARNLVRGHGLVLTPGSERVEASTSFLWMMILAVPEALGSSCVEWSKRLGVAFAAAALVVVALVPSALHQRRPRPVDALVPFGSALLPLYAQWAVNGLENGLMAFVIALTLWFFAREEANPDARARVPLSAVGAVALFLTRPDGLLYVAVVAGAVVTRLFDRSRRRDVLRWFVVAGGAVGLFMAFRLAYFALPWPCTFYAKRSELSLRARLLDTHTAGWRYVISFARTYQLDRALLLVPLAAASTRSWRTRLVLVGFVVAAFFFPIYSTGDWMVEFRFLSFGAPVVLLAIFEAVRVIGHPLGRLLGRVGFAPQAALAAAVAVPFTRFADGQLARRDQTMKARSTTYAWVGARTHHMNEIQRRLDLPWYTSLADPDVGATSHLGTFEVHDLVGLADLAVAMHLRKPTAAREVLFDEWKPSFIHLHAPWTNLWPVERLEEMTYGYFTLPARLPDLNPEGGVFDFVPTRLRRELVAAPWARVAEDVPSPALDRKAAAPVSMSMLRGFTVSHKALAATGSGLLELRFTRAGRGVGAVVLTDATRPAGPGRETVLPLAIGAGLIAPGDVLDGESAAARVTLRPSASRTQVSWRAADGRSTALFEVVRDPSAAAAEGAALRRDLTTAVAAGRIDEARRLALRCALRVSLEPGDRDAREALATFARAAANTALVMARAGATSIAVQVARDAWALDRPAGEVRDRLDELAGVLAAAAAAAERGSDRPRAFILARDAVALDPTRSWSRRRAERLRLDRVARGDYDGARDQMAYRVAARAAAGGAPFDEAIVLLGRVGRYRDAAALARVTGHVPASSEARRVLLRGALELGERPAPSLLEPCAREADPELARALDVLTPPLPRAACPAPPPPPPDRLPGASFEGATFAPWRVSGDAFGAPSATTRINDITVAGFSGLQYADSFAAMADAGRGVVSSPPFSIVARGLSFVVGGGSRNEVGVRLLVDGKPTSLRAAGMADLHMRRVFWDVSMYLGKTAQIEIYDDATGPWSHIRADDFRFEPYPLAW